MDLEMKPLCLFDVDGTLTKPRQVITKDVFEFLKEKIKPHYDIALVGGSDYSKINEQMGGSGLNEFAFIFSENGLVARKNGEIIGTESIQNFIGEEQLQEFINFALRYMSALNLPAKRGTFVEFRTGLINICPVGRSCSQKEREQFAEYDQVHCVREKFIQAITKQFPNLPFKYSIGGQISFDVFPKGWDKTYCLKYLDDYTTIHFFGDKTQPGGNDYEMSQSPRVTSHTVKGPEDTVKQLRQLLSTL
uniref:Phosphomannomutase n=1 Tax=Panstrongylus lignarius TaxID=156445 RepID=A0A224XWK8_9HEMI